MRRFGTQGVALAWDGSLCDALETGVGGAHFYRRRDIGSNNLGTIMCPCSTISPCVVRLEC